LDPSLTILRQLRLKAATAEPASKEVVNILGIFGQQNLGKRGYSFRSAT
jgi:hypothetical protein